MPGDLILYDFDGSPCARRVRISMLEKGLDWHRQEIDLSRLEQRDPRYLAINPNGLVPAFAHGNRVLWESNVITEYLDDAFPDVKLWPTDPGARLEVRRWQAAELQMAKDYRPLMYQRLLGPVIRMSRTLDEALRIARRSTSDPADLAWERKVWSLEVLTLEEEAATEARLYNWLADLDQALRDRDWLVGGAFGQAEISVYPRVHMFPWVGLHIDARYPNVRRWMASLENRASFRRTMSRQERRMEALARSPVFALARSGLAKAGEPRTLRERAVAFALGSFIRFMDRGNLYAAMGQRKPLRLPDPADAAPATPRQRQLAKPEGVFLLKVDPGRPEKVALEWALRHIGLPHRISPAEGMALEHQGQTITDFSIALEYLDAFAPEGREIFPVDAWGAAQIRMWLAFSASLHKEFEPLYRRHVRHQPGLGEDEANRLRRVLSGRLDGIETLLVDRKWIGPEGYLLADMALAARIDLFQRFGIDAMAHRPRLKAWRLRLDDTRMRAKRA